MLTGSGKKCKYLGNVWYAFLIKPLICIEYLLHNGLAIVVVVIYLIGHNGENKTAWFLTCTYLHLWFCCIM